MSFKTWMKEAFAACILFGTLLGIMLGIGGIELGLTMPISVLLLITGYIIVFSARAVQYIGSVRQTTIC